MSHQCKHHGSRDLDKVKLDLQLKASLQPSDPKLFYAETLGCHPESGVECWIYDPVYYFVARGVIMSKTPGTSDTHATWRIRITKVENKFYSYYDGMRDTFLRSQIWPTKRECYTALHDYLEQKVKENVKQNKEFLKRCTQIKRFM